MQGMSDVSDSPGGPDISPELAGNLDRALDAFKDELVRLDGDTEWIVRALTETLQALRPVSAESLSQAEARYLIESGAFTLEQLAETQIRVERGSLQKGAIEAFLTDLRGTLSLEQVAEYLGLSDLEVRDAVADRRLYAVEIADQLRFPTWQFMLSRGQKLIPGLPRLIDEFGDQRSWQSVAAFMRTPQEDLVVEAPQTPTDWVRRGGDIEALCSLIASTGWA